MARDSKIEWTRHTFNPWWGCERVSPACKNCYAETWAHRLGLDLWFKNAPRRMMSDGYWQQPLAWEKQASAAGRRDRVFCASMADVFEDRSDLDEARERLWGLIAKTPNLDWLLLTKRPHCVGKMVPWTNVWPRNVWLGTTVENQRWAEKRLPHLLAHPASVHFLSCEPLLGQIDISRWLTSTSAPKVGWVIAGGESGHRARPMNPEWTRNLRDQCNKFDVPFHFKQWGNWSPAEHERDGRNIRFMPGSDGTRIAMVRLNKKQSGRTLDGQQWNELPATA